MNQIFESDATVATPSDVESNFRTLKNSILQHKIIRADRFLDIHIKNVDAEIKSVIIEKMERKVKAKGENVFQF